MSDSMRCRGMRDLLPDQMLRFRRIENTFRDVCQGWGYEEVRTPTVEHLHLFTSAGTLSPQMLERVYSFLDWDGWSGERVVLRPDSTIPLARMFAESAGPGEVWKRFYVQSVLRFASGDESREDWQCGVELIGDTQPVGDVELVLVATEVLRRLGLGAMLKLSHPGIVKALLVKAGYDAVEQLALYDSLLEGDVGAFERAAERIPDVGGALRHLLTMDGEGGPFLRNLRAATVGPIPEVEASIDELLAVSETLTSVGTEHRVSPLLVRNFEYYTGPVFSLEIAGLRVGGGGRYDSLIGLVGDTGVPASGFALDVDSLMPLLDEAGTKAAALVVRPEGPGREALTATFALAGALQAAGVAFRIANSEDPGDGAEAVAGGDGYTLRLNGSGLQRYGGAEEVVRAITSSRQ